jgi:hypothetical protein
MWRTYANMHAPPAEGNFCEHGNAIKISNCCGLQQAHGICWQSGQDGIHSICCRTWKWTNKLFFHLLDLMVLNSFILSCGAKLLHRDFSPPRPQRPMGRPPDQSTTISRLEEANRHHWPTSSTKRMLLLCHVCSTCGKRRVQTKCTTCNIIGLCIIGASRTTTKRRVAVRWHRGEAYIYNHITT